MAQSNDSGASEVSPIMQQLGTLNLRINDMMTQLNTVIKALLDENGVQKKEIADLKAMQQQQTSQT